MELCKIKGHKWFYTDEYADSEEEHVQADSICERCGYVEMAWTGPTKSRIENATDEEVPTKEEAYEQLPTEISRKVSH